MGCHPTSGIYLNIMQKPLYFIALLPGMEIGEEVTRFKEYAAEHFKSSRALRSPPHITLFPPFRWAEEESLIGSLQSFAVGEEPVPVFLTGFNCFAPRVIYVDVALSDELKALQRRLEIHLEKSLGMKNKSKHDFHPHMTVAFKDLRRSLFKEAWAYFSEIAYDRFFEARSVALLKHSGKRWEVYREFEMEGFRKQ